MYQINQVSLNMQLSLLPNYSLSFDPNDLGIPGLSKYLAHSPFEIQDILDGFVNQKGLCFYHLSSENNRITRCIVSEKLMSRYDIFVRNFKKYPVITCATIILALMCESMMLTYAITYLIIFLIRNSIRTLTYCCFWCETDSSNISNISTLTCLHKSDTFNFLSWMDLFALMFNFWIFSKYPSIDTPSRFTRSYKIN